MANRYEPGEYLGAFLNQLPQIYQAKKSAELQRERFEYYKGKDAQALQEKQAKEIYNQNVRTWTQMQNFAQEMPFGQQANFLRKQIDTLPQDFVENQNINKFIDNYEIIEGNEVDQISMFDNARIEDNPGKIRMTAAQMQDPKRKKQLISDAKKLESSFFKQKSFDLNKLSPTEKRDYTTISDLLKEQEKILLQSTLPGAVGGEAMATQANQAAQSIKILQERLQPLLTKGAPITIPEFNYSPESYQALINDPDLMSSFLASPDDDMDSFYNSTKNSLSEPAVEPAPETIIEPPPPRGNQGVAQGSMWQEDKVSVSVAGKPQVVTGGFKLKPNAPIEYKGPAGERKRQQEEAQLAKTIQEYENEINKANKIVSQIDKVIVNLTGNAKESAQKQKNKSLSTINFYKNKLSEIRPKYDYIKKPKRSSSVKKKIKN